MEILSGKKYGKYNKEPRITAQQLENLQGGLKFINEQGLKYGVVVVLRPLPIAPLLFGAITILQQLTMYRLVNIGPSDIHSGNLKLILGLLWTIIYHYQGPHTALCSPFTPIHPLSVQGLQGRRPAPWQEGRRCQGPAARGAVSPSFL